MLYKLIKKNWIVILIFLSALLMRLPFQSPYLEDWDSVQFALGLHQYSVVLHQPHPPGYPIYILLGKLSYLFFQDDNKSLTFLSTLFGSLSSILIYFLSKRMFNQKIAIVASLIYIVTPVGWMLSGVANSNMTGLFFELGFIYLIYRFINDKNKALLLGFIAGLILGIRFTDFPIIATLLLFTCIKNHKFDYIIKIIFSFTVGIAIWLIPLLIVTGVKEFWQAYQDVAYYVRWHDTLLGQSYTLKHLLKVRLEYLWQLLQPSYTIYFIILAVISFILTLVQKKNWSKTNYQLLIIWFSSYFFPLIFFYNLELPQYTLPLLPPLAILIASTMVVLVKNKYLLPLFTVLFILLLAQAGWPQIKVQAYDIPPTITPVKYVKNNFDPKDTVLITTFTYRQFQYYAPEFINFYGPDKLPTKIQAKTVIIDYEGLKREIPALSKYQIKEAKKFTHSQEVLFPRLKEIKLYILTP